MLCVGVCVGVCVWACVGVWVGVVQWVRTGHGTLQPILFAFTHGYVHLSSTTSFTASATDTAANRATARRTKRLMVILRLRSLFETVQKRLIFLRGSHWRRSERDLTLFDMSIMATMFPPYLLIYGSIWCSWSLFPD